MTFKRKNIVRFLILFGIISLVSVVGLQFQCNKFGCEENLFNFAIWIKTYPDKDSIHIGDTIWLEVDEPTTQKEVQTGNMIDYSGAVNLGSAIGFQVFSSVSGQFTIGAAQKFNLLLLQGRETGNADASVYHEFLFAEVNNSYLFKLGIIPKETGIYRIVFSNAANVYRKNNCKKASFGLNFKNTNQHYYLNPNFQGGPTAIGGDYYFKVN